MDEMKIVTKFMKGAVSKVLERTVKNKIGYETHIRLNEINVSNGDEGAHIHLDIDAEMSHSELFRILKSIGLG